MAGADLSGRDLRGADLEGADLTGANLSGAKLIEAVLDLASLAGADLSGADLVRASLRRADLAGACLRGADLRDADLEGADLTDADLAGAHLEGADLSGTNVAEARPVVAAGAEPGEQVAALLIRLLDAGQADEARRILDDEVSLTALATLGTGREVLIRIPAANRDLAAALGATGLLPPSGGDGGEPRAMGKRFRPRTGALSIGVTTAHGPRTLRQWEATPDTEQRLAAERALLSDLAAASVPAPVPLGEPVEIGGYVYDALAEPTGVASPFPPGSPLTAAPAASLGGLLARFHAASGPPAEGHPPWPDRRDAFLRRHDVPYPDALFGLTVEHLVAVEDDLEELVDAALTRIRDRLAPLPLHRCHGAFAPSSVLWEAEEPVAVESAEHAWLAPRELDLAWALQALPGGEHAAAAFLDGYSSVVPLTEDEATTALTLIPAAILLDALTRITQSEWAGPSNTLVREFQRLMGGVGSFII